jgi:hypothetical protein
MRTALIGAAAGVALMSASTIGMAQTPGGSESPGKMQGPSAQTPAPQGPMRTQPGDKADGPRAPGKGEVKRAPDSAPGKGPSAAESQHEKSQPSSQTAPEKGNPKATEREPQNSQPKASERQPGNSQKSSQGQPQGNRVQVSEQQRNGVRDRLLKEGSFQKTKLNVHVSVGTRLPRSVRLLPLSVAIIELAPTYRGYDYLVLEDETICIVDPSSYEIVDVLPVGTQRAERPERPALGLSQEQMRFIAGNVAREPQANVHLRLALGAEVRPDVELLVFPREVVSRLPELEGYRYVVTENDIAVVDPRDRGVVLVITE